MTGGRSPAVQAIGIEPRSVERWASGLQLRIVRQVGERAAVAAGFDAAVALADLGESGWQPA